MPDVLGAGLRWLKGEKGKSFKEPIEACVGPDVIESRRLHQMARNMGLESDSEEERLNNRTVRSERHRERVKHRPPPDKYSPEGSSRSGTMIDYSKTGGYQRSIWLKDGDHSSDSDRLPRHDSPQVKNTRKSSDYPNTNLGPSGKPWGQQISISQSAPDDYSMPYESSGNLHVGSPREAARLSTSANSSEYVPRVDRSAHESNNRRGPPYSNQRPPSPHLKFDPVRDAAAQNDVISRHHSNYEAPISSRVIPVRKPVPHSHLQHPSIARKEAKELNPKHLAELAIINRRNEEEVLRQRRARKLLNSPQESEESDEDYYEDTARGRRQYEEDKRLFKNYQARQGDGKLLPLPLPSKLPPSLNQHSSPPPRSAASPLGFPIPFRPVSLMEDEEPHNSWPGHIKPPPDPRTSTVMPPPRRTPVSSSAWENNPRAPPYPVTPHNYHLNGYNNQNDVQKRAVHDAFQDMMLHGHERIAGPTPPTFRSSYPDAMELSGVSPEIRRDGTRRHTAGGNEVLGQRSRTPEFAVRIDMDIYRPATIQETEEERAGGGISGVERMELHGESRRLGAIGDRRRERPVPEIRVQHPTPIASLRESHGVNIGRTRRSAEIERLVAPRSDHGERRKHEKHSKHGEH
ncbi:uncharacterized protein EAE98_004065 [Botrytis deweyae]|uniref:Uncharacterized protein n=1 Tax=Botrytis deweyae TaxID=2478750 RepID=A0ABQ7ISH1_9HELO|nr:uncharacterized protein EAE98_004065 [Botrytis deweyae]KAF7932766.1 hypothetical protein EAE98_004065 [Botrytis deweyae]